MMFPWFSKPQPEPERKDRASEHEFAMRLSEGFREPVRSMTRAIMPPSCDPTWERGYYPVMEEIRVKVREFELMYAAMQQRSGKVDLRVVGGGQ